MHATRCRVQEREGVAGDEQKIEVKGLQHEVGPQTWLFPSRFLFYCYAAAPGRVRLLQGPAGYAVVGIFDGSLKNGLFR